jgi:hypothetical protein
VRKLAIIAGILILVAAIAAGIFLMRNKVVVSSTEVERLAAQMLPGAAPPSGLKGVLALHPQDLQVAIFAPSFDKADAANLKGSDLRILIARPDRAQEQSPSPSEIREKIDKARERKSEEMDTLMQVPARLSVGGTSYPGIKSSLAVKSNGVRLTEYMTVFKRDTGPVVVLMTGPEGSFSQSAMEQFLARVEAPASPLGGAKAPAEAKAPLARPPGVPAADPPRAGGPPRLPGRPGPP